MIFWSMAWRNLRLHRRRSLVTGLAIAFGFCGVVLLGGYMMRMENYLKTQGIYLTHSGHLSIYKKEGLQKHLNDPDLFSLSGEDQQNILTAVHELPSQPAYVAKYLHGQGLITNGCRSFPFFLTASEPAAENWVRNNPQVQYWVPELVSLKLGKGYWDAGTSEDSIVVAYRLARLLHKPLIEGDPKDDAASASKIITNCESSDALPTIESNTSVQIFGNSYAGGLAASDATISGHFTTGLVMSDAGSILTSLSFAQKFFGTDKVTSMAIFLGEKDSTSSVESKLRKIFSNHKWDYDIYTYRDDRINQYYVGAMNFVYVMMIFFLDLVCGVVALSILNSLQISLLERKIELGTLRSVGFKQKTVAALFVREVLLLSCLSIIAGGALAYVIAHSINAMNLRFALVGTADEIQFLLKPEMWLTILTGLVFVCVACGTCYFEARRRLKAPVTSLLEYGG
jgi:putative ABC transport system permease protein